MSGNWNETEEMILLETMEVKQQGRLTREIGGSLLERAKQVAASILERVRHATEYDAPKTPPMRVLVIDDEQDTLLSFAYLFSVFGYDTSFALTPAQAIAEALDHRPDAVVCDIRLHGVDGCDLVRELLAITHAVDGTAPLLIAMTGLGEEARGRCIAAGFNHFFTKPADPAVLEALLRKHARSLADNATK